MKKVLFLGLGVLAASLVFTGCELTTTRAKLLETTNFGAAGTTSGEPFGGLLGTVSSLAASGWYSDFVTLAGG